MFPSNDFDMFIKDEQNSDLPSVPKKSFAFDYEKRQFELVDGKPVEIFDVDAVKQWIILFFATPLDKYEIYKGTKFGHTIRNLFGQKVLNNGYEEAEVERQINEGFVLCPDIESVTSFDMRKQNNRIVISVGVRLHNGQEINNIEGVVKL